MRQRRGIAGILPGRLLDGWRALAARLDQIEGAARWDRVPDPPRPTSSLLTTLGPEDPLIAYYHHLVHDFKSAVHEVDRAAIAAFIDERIEPARHQGVDLTVCTHDFSRMVSFNHDGDVFVVSPAGT